MSALTVATADDAVMAVRALVTEEVAQFGGILEAFNDDRGFALLQAERRAVDALVAGATMIAIHSTEIFIDQP